MKLISLSSVLVLWVALSASAQTSLPPHDPVPHKPAATAAPVHPATKGPAAAKTTVKTGPSTKKGPARVSTATSKSARKSPGATTAYRRSQLTPTADRYREIQQALSDRGYLKNEPNGVWDQQSTDALKQFQTENKLTPTGKLSSLSLIQLGLGPKHDRGPVSLPTSVEPPPYQPPVEPPPLPPPVN